MTVHGERRKKKAVVNIKHATIQEMPKEGYDPSRYDKEEDVRALARAHAIKKDPARHQAARHHAKSMKDEHVKRRAESDAIVKMAEKG